ncbi:conserved hypothetical protein [Xenorhabdus bovienii str. puntauvense]|uniref:Uncharacterized protein n=1 Tax=Xenorhabdus bovienii str. puntauvense TaxID=1398201 RepID=A0A077NIB3_XENBV|nr:conserved hypothetical protein [Xenorhabdus bovienii str. puntauvense]
MRYQFPISGQALLTALFPGSKYHNEIMELNMVHPGGFEPPTARFVAEYSIQLSYGCILKMAVREGFEPSMQLLTTYSLSRGAPSASRPPHHSL